MNRDHAPYYRLAGKSRLEKSVNSLLGLVEGIAIDRAINRGEIEFLRLWIEEHADVRNSHPYTELLPVVASAIEDGVLTKEEHDDIVWLCERLTNSDYFDQTTTDLQKLHAILAGIASDGIVSRAELDGLSEWIQRHEHLKSCWPYDEADSIVTSILADGRIDEEEHKQILSFLGEFVDIADGRTISNPGVLSEGSIQGVCAVCPQIEFARKRFCFTGASTRYPRSRLFEIVQQLGGETSKGLTQQVDYLVIGADGNPCWAYACYGRKVEAAIALRKQGSRLLIIHESDFHDAVADNI